MPLPNRIRPDGSLFADPARGLLFGNRGGRFHDPQTKALPNRIHASRQWICCVLAFKGRRHEVWERSYTALFFCDEVTALAAGHRPCVECRRQDAHAWRAALVEGLGLRETPLFPELDRMLDRQRRDGRTKRLHRAEAATLPDGAMIEDGAGGWLAIRQGKSLSWSPAGYTASLARPTGTVNVLTPPATIAALASGYRPIWHHSAGPLATSSVGAMTP